MSTRLEKLKGTRAYGYLILLAMVLFFYAVFKILTPGNYGSPANLYSYLQSSIIYSVGGCGLYFIVVMGLFDFAVGANIVLSSIVGVILSQHFGYAGFIIGCLGCGTLIGFLMTIVVGKAASGSDALGLEIEANPVALILFFIFLVIVFTGTVFFPIRNLKKMKIAEQIKYE